MLFPGNSPENPNLDFLNQKESFDPLFNKPLTQLLTTNKAIPASIYMHEEMN
jgi:hypothetical protein